MLRAVIIFLALPGLSPAQQNAAAAAARHWRQAHEPAIIGEFVELLSIPNIASDRVNIRRNAQAIVKLMQKRRVPAQLVEEPGANPVVWGEVRAPGATRTIVFYAHYDGQPLDPKEWLTPPFAPVLRERAIEKDGQVIPLAGATFPLDPESRLYARSASDDKAPILAMMTALDAIRAAGLKLHSNIRFVIEGEEESGSVNLGRILAAHKDLFAADLWLICDGPVAQSRRQLIAFGARGVTIADITVYGPRRELHSGHYGNWAPNPAMMLARLLASMKDDNGRVLIENFYKGIVPLSALEKDAIAKAPKNDSMLKNESLLGHVDGGGKPLLELLNYPSLNINGISSGRTGARANNVIPAMAMVDLDLRLVAGMDWKQQQQRVIDFIASHGYFVTETEPDAQVLLRHPKVALVRRSDGYNAVRTPMDLPIAKEVIDAAGTAHHPVVLWPTMGGSVPLGAIETAASTHTITVPIANYDNNQHSANENIRLQNLWDGIETMAALMTMK